MFSSIKNAILDRTNCPRDEQEERDEDKPESVPVDPPDEQGQRSTSVEFTAPVTEFQDLDTPRDSLDTGELPVIASSSQHPTSDGAWKFVKSDSLRRPFPMSTCVVARVFFDLMKDWLT